MEGDLRSLELRQAVVFAARFELYAQRFKLAGVELQQSVTSTVEVIPADWVPVENPARIREYWADVLPPGTPQRDYPPHWCGAFCLFALHRAGLATDVFWRGGFAARVLRQIDTSEEAPRPGDVAYFKKNQHHALVESVDAIARTVDTIDGNQQPGIVRKLGRRFSSVAAFYSIGPLLEEKEAA